MSASLTARTSHLTFDRLALALFFVAVTLAACVMPAQTDTWWQLRTGEEMWRSHQVMLRDGFSHTVPGGYWPNHEWLSQLIFYAAYRLGGLPLLTAVCAASITTAWALVASLTPGPRLRRVFLLGAGAILSSPSWSLRPQVFSFALLALTMWILVRRRWTWSLPPLFVLWANLHGGVALGGVLLVAATAAALMEDRRRFKMLACVTFVSGLCTAATPLGFTLWREVPASLARLHAYGVVEWQAPGLTLQDVPFWIVALTIAGLLWVNRSGLRASPDTPLFAAAGVAFLACALRTRRNIPPFVLSAVPLSGTLLNHVFQAKANARTERPLFNALVLAGTAAMGTAAVVMAWSRPAPRLGWQPVSAELRRAVTACPGRLYNRYDDGGYLIWFAREKKVFIDSRQDPFPEEMVRDHISLEESGSYETVFARYDIGCALTVQGSPLAASLRQRGWGATSGEGTWVLFQRPDSTALLVRSDARAGSE
jgi:hypothetical protein